MTLRCKPGSKHHMQPSLGCILHIEHRENSLSLICYYQCNSSISVSWRDKKQTPEEDRSNGMMFYWLGIALIVD